LALGRKEGEETVKTEWTVTIEGRPAKVVDPEDILEELAEFSPAVQFGNGLLSITATRRANSAIEAYDYIHEALNPLTGKLEIELVEIKTIERQDRDLEVSNLPELVGLAEIADIAGTTRQRVFQMTANRGFPFPVMELRSGRLWNKAAVETYLGNRRPRILPVPGIVARASAEENHSRVQRGLPVARARGADRAVHRPRRS
jgi:hypothetical protein